MSTVTFNGVRVNNSDSSTGWANNGGGGPSPASEPQLKYQGTGAVNKKVTTTTSRGGIRYSGGSNNVVSSHKLWIFKGKVADAGDLNTTYGVESQIGSGTSAFHAYNLSGSGANNDQYADGYSSQGGLAEGYIVTAINPNISQWRESTSGSPSLTAINHYAIGAQFVTGGAKSENVALDALDLATGLDYSGTAFTFQDGVDFDQGTVNNRYGLSCQNGSVISLRGLHRLAQGGSLVGTDTSNVIFPDGYHGTNDCGFNIDLTNASTDFELAGSYAGLGKLYTSDDTRPVITATTGSGSCLLSGTFPAYSSIEIVAGMIADGMVVRDSGLVTQSGGQLTDINIQNPTDTYAVKIDDLTKVTKLVTNGSIDLTSETATEITITNIDADNITVNNSADVTLNLVNSNITSATNTGAGTVITQAAVPLDFENIVSGSRLYIRATDTVGSITAGDVLVNEVITTNPFSTLHNYEGNLSFLYRVRNHSGSPYYKDIESQGTITSSGFSAFINQILDE